MLAMPTFEIYQDVTGEWRWRFKADNDKIIADSAEGYHHIDDCRSAIYILKDNAAKATILGY